MRTHFCRLFVQARYMRRTRPAPRATLLRDYSLIVLACEVCQRELRCPRCFSLHDACTNPQLMNLWALNEDAAAALTRVPGFQVRDAPLRFEASARA